MYLQIIKTVLPFVLVAAASSGITYQVMSGNVAKKELKEEKLSNEDKAKREDKLGNVSIKQEENRQQIERIKLVTKTEWKTEYKTNTVYIDKACMIPASGIALLDDYADKLNSIGEN